MRSLVVLLLIVALCVTGCAAGGAEHQFTPPAKLPIKTLPEQQESMPATTLPTRTLPPVTHLHYIEQEIEAPKTINQPVVQQQLVEQPILRTHVQKQPIVRRVIEQTVVRPRVRIPVRLVPIITQQKVHVNRYIDQNILQEKYAEEHETAPIQYAKATFDNPKKAQHLFGARPWEAIEKMVRESGKYTEQGAALGNTLKAEAPSESSSN